MTRIVCIIQARMGSKRLPGKISMDIAGKPMLARVIERAKHFAHIAQVITATSVSPQDDLTQQIARDMEVDCFRGSEQDVLSRYFEAARLCKAEAVMRITADCPLIDPAVSNRVTREFLEKRPDYASNTIKRTHPRGLDTAIITMDTLTRAHKEAVDPADREHVNRFVWRQPEKFDILSITGDEDHSHHRWTVDTPEDLKLVRKIYGELGDRLFGMKEILYVLKQNPEWTKINAMVEQVS